jgi:hypothetical protein
MTAPGSGPIPRRLRTPCWPSWRRTASWDSLRQSGPLGWMSEGLRRGTRWS